MTFASLLDLFSLVSNRGHKKDHQANPIFKSDPFGHRLHTPITERKATEELKAKAAKIRPEVQAAIKKARTKAAGYDLSIRANVYQKELAKGLDAICKKHEVTRDDLNKIMGAR